MEKLIQQLGDKDPVIRDDGAYLSLEKFIKSEENTAESNSFLYGRLLKEIKQKGKSIELILKRSFSALVLSVVIFEDNKRFGKLESSELKEAFKVIKDYGGDEDCLIEKDDKLGWVHCYAHIGDVLSTLVIHKNTNFAQEITEFILETEKLRNLGKDSLERFKQPINLAKALGKIS